MALRITAATLTLPIYPTPGTSGTLRYVVADENDPELQKRGEIAVTISDNQRSDWAKFCEDALRAAAKLSF